MEMWQLMGTTATRKLIAGGVAALVAGGAAVATLTMGEHESKQGELRDFAKATASQQFRLPVPFARVRTTASAFSRAEGRQRARDLAPWREIGPSVMDVVSEATQTGGLPTQ